MRTLSEAWRKRVKIIYHALVILLSIFLCFGLGVISYHGLGNERGTWALATVSGMFGMLLILYVTYLGELFINKLRGK
jgi:hypothetical protein